VGIIHAINKLHNDVPGLNLAVSLHAPAQDIRCQIMPAARAFPLEKLMDSLQEYQRKSLQKILIEYIMLDGVNDEEQHAHLLGKLLETFEVVVNLIPFNSIGTLSQFKSTSEQKVSNFQKILRGTYNIRTKVRKQMGEDISGACGQLGDLCRNVIANDEFENSGSESENSENSEPESENSEPESENSSETLSENENFAEIICDTYFAPNKAKDTHLVQTDFLDVILTLLWFASPSDERPNHSFQRMLRCLRYLPVDYLADEAMDQLTEEDLDLILVSISGIEDSTIELKANAMKFYQRAKLRVKQQDPYYPNAHDPSLMTEMLEKIICRLDDYYSHQKEKRKLNLTKERDELAAAVKKLSHDFAKAKGSYPLPLHIILLKEFIHFPWGEHRLLFVSDMVDSKLNMNPVEDCYVTLELRVEVEVERPGQLKASGMKEIDFKKQAEVETIDTRTCDQAVPKAYTEMDDDESGYTTHHSYSGSSDVGKTIDEEGQTHNIAGILFFRQARSCLSYEQYSAFLATIKKFVAKKQTREETLENADKIFGSDNKDLYLSFQGLLNRNVPDPTQHSWADVLTHFASIF
ncbi:dual-specificity RNA methyltransferase RlmN 1-like protein, partial [Trifolium pratense]